jgi:hypothetical protein
MSSRALTAALLLMAAQLAGGEDWSALAARSDRGDDAFLIQAIASVDFDTRLLICRGVGRRADPCAEDIMDFFFSRRGTRENDRDTLLLRELLGGLFDPARGEAELRLRVKANTTALSAMALHVNAMDPQLAGALVRLLRFLPSGTALPALAGVGTRLLSSLRRQNGVIPVQESALALDFLGAAAAMKSRDSLDQCVQVAELSREKPVVDEARRAIGVLLGP